MFIVHSYEQSASCLYVDDSLFRQRPTEWTIDGDKIRLHYKEENT